MDLTAFHQLLTPAGQEILQAAEVLSPKESDFLIHFQSLGRRFPHDLARAALEVAILRREAAAKFPFADKLYLSRQALEQASSHEVSSHRAERFRSYPYLADLGCSIGADSFALAKIAPTLAVDIDLLRLSMASANLHSLGLSGNIQPVQSDITFPFPFKPGSAALFFDPARRVSHQRVFSVSQYRPPLSIVKDWLPGNPALGVKISPGVSLSELGGYDAEIEFISLHGELKEAVLWFGPLKTAVRRATVLPGPFQLSADLPYQLPGSTSVITEPKSILYEPDPAVIRAGMVTTLAEMLDASQLDPDIAYLTSGSLSPTPFARHWVIEDWFPFQLKQLRTYLQQRHIGKVTVKKRGSPIEPEFLTPQLRRKGDLKRVVVLTQLRNEPIVMICIRV